MKDLVTAIFSIVIGISAYLYSNTFTDPSGGFANDPAYYPQVICIVFLGLGLILLFQTLKERKVKLPKRINLHENHVTKLAILILLLMVYAAVFESIGFAIGTVLFLFCAMLLYGSKRTIAGFFSLGITGVLYLIFFVLFGVPYPQGILF